MGTRDRWSIVETSPAGSNWSMLLPISEGFVLRDRGVVVVTPQDLGGPTATTAPGQGQAALLAHLGRLRDRRRRRPHRPWRRAFFADWSRSSATAGPWTRFACPTQDDASLLVPMEEIGALWRYGADPGDLKLDRLKGEGWINRRNDLLSVSRIRRAGWST